MKRKYKYFPVISFHGGQSKIAFDARPTFIDAWKSLVKHVEAYYGNRIDFAGVIKTDSENPFNRVVGL